MTLKTDSITSNDKELVARIAAAETRIKSELSKAVLGQEAVIDELLIALLSGGNALITGAPGLAKTLLVSSIAKLFHLSFNRIQFTPDLMPADITGTEILAEGADGVRRLEFVKGPLFANLILADEINRTPPKTQSALLEAMQEHQVSVAGVGYPLPEPFFVLATKNPVEMEGTYPLPEAQLDRFMFDIHIDYLSEDEEVAVVAKTTKTENEVIEPLFTGEDLLSFQEIVRGVPIAKETTRYAVRLAAASRPKSEKAPDFINQWVNWGAGLRAAQSLVLGAKARALLKGKTHVAPADIQALAHPVLRHRILANFRAEAEGITSDSLVDRLLEHVPTP
ncbi:MAG: MoxR family ATPase [Verrucomicrobiota bacterium]